MSRVQYQRAANRVRWIITAWTLVFVVLSTVLFELLGAPIASYGLLIRGHLGELLGGLAGGLTLVAPAFLVYMAVMLPLDRHFGLRCPNCHRSLTLRCRHEDVASTGQCSLCHQKVFNES